MDEGRMLAAIDRLLAVVNGPKASEDAATNAQISALRRIAAGMASWCEQEIDHVLDRIARHRLTVEPLEHPYSVFRMFGVEANETRWTQFLANLWRRDNGRRCAELTWAAFCNAVVRSMNVLAPKPTTTTSDILASSQEWTIAGTAFVEIEDEVVAGDLGRLDLLATVPHMTAVIENKLFAHWHGANQADRYRDLGLGRIVNTDRKLGLVILSQNELQPVEDYPPDYVHVTWADFGRCLRRSLAAEPSLDLELMPVVYLIIAIEQDLVGLSLGASMKGLARLKVLQTTAAYMEGR